MPPIVALLTDLGMEGPYVGALKGAVLKACPGATLVDISHTIPPQDVARGAEVLRASYRHFPAGTVFLGVVDPGVGTTRRGIVVAASGFVFVGPDNGLFSAPLEDDKAAVVHAIAENRQAGPSPTFHGRDVFAPIAGRLAAGGALDDVGPRIHDLARLVVSEARQADDGSWEITVVDVDVFGNLTTNLGGDKLQRFLGQSGGRARLEDDPIRIVRTYGDAQPGEVMLLVGSSDRLEIAVNRGDAATRIKARVGRRLAVRPARR